MCIRCGVGMAQRGLLHPRHSVDAAVGGRGGVVLVQEVGRRGEGGGGGGG